VYWFTGPCAYRDKLWNVLRFFVRRFSRHDT
jgi:hypothetical protein